MLAAAREQASMRTSIESVAKGTCYFQADFSENIGVPLANEESSDMWHGAARKTLSVFGVYLRQWEDGQLRTKNILYVSEVLEKSSLLLYWYAKPWRKKSSTWDASRSYYLFLTLGIILGVTNKLTTPWYTYQLNIPNLAWQGTWLRNMERDLAAHSCSPLQWDAFSNKPVCTQTSSHRMKTMLFGACRKQRPMKQQLILMVQSGLLRCLTCRSKGHLQRCSPCWIVKSTAAIALKLFSASIRVLV